MAMGRAGFSGLMKCGVLAASVLLVQCQEAKPIDGPNKSAPTPSGVGSEANPYLQLGELRAKVLSRRFSAEDLSAFNAALRTRFPRGGEVLGHRDFYFDGEATRCGVFQPRGLASARFIYRNRFIAWELSMASDDFAMFWKICLAAGAVP
jgi:hypothetical protein